MKTIDEWLQKYATTVSSQFDLRDLIKEIRREAFERCQQVALQVPPGRLEFGRWLADRIADVYRDEGEE